MIRIIVTVVLLTLGAAVFYGQSADDKTPLLPRPGDAKEEHPASFNENLEKLRIEREKKDFDEMIERGQEALKLSEDLEKTYTANGRLTPKEIEKAASVEKLAKKIRNELGGDDETDNDDPAPDAAVAPGRTMSLNDAVKSLRTSTVALFDELKKTSRFSISAAAIQCSNSVIRLARFLRISK